MPRLGIIITSTRPNRVGEPVARWFAEKARSHGKFEIEVIDLKQVNLPPLDEPEHPVHRKYQHEHTRAWSHTIAALDAFVFVVPEYHFGPPPALLNAMDFLSQEWSYKAAGYVSYGGVSAGTRSAQMCRLLATSVRMVPLFEQVSIPFVAKLVDTAGKFEAGPTQDQAATRMLDELLRWTDALRGLREEMRKTFGY